MLLRLHRPRPPLDAFVEVITYFEGHDSPHSREKLLPDGAVEIIIDLTDTPKRLYHREDTSRSRAFRGAWISGMRHDWIVIEAASNSSMAVIRFRPGGAYPFLGFPLGEVTDVVEELDRVLGPRLGSLRDRVLSAGTPDARLAAIEDWLLAAAGGAPEGDPAVDAVVRALSRPGAVRIADVVDRIGFSHRHTIQLFRRWVGMTPKAYCRIRKFQQAVHGLAGAPEAPDWADLAQECGYYDQAHFINEFRRLSGLSPTAYRESCGEYLNYIPLD